MAAVLLYVGSGVLVVWGAMHIIPTAGVVRGFGDISKDNRRIITMEWVAEGMTLCFIGILVILVTAVGGDRTSAPSRVVYYASAGMLAVMALWTLATGSRTSIVPIKICPLVKSLCAVLFILGASL